MNPSELVRRGIVNQGAFFPPYYLFDLLGRRHADELDPQGREANRRLLRRPFRAAYARYGESGSAAGEAWMAWHREMFEALGFLGPDGSPLQRLDTPVETARHGWVPISHVAYAAPATDAGLASRGAEPATASIPTMEDDEHRALVYVDLHGFGTDLDRDRYPASLSSAHPITEEPIARAIEFALDHNPARWAIVAAGDRLRLYRKGGSVARQYLEVNLPALLDADRTDEWTAFWGLFRYQAFVPDPQTDKCFLDRVLEESQRHAARIADDLRENVVLAVEALIQGILDDPANKPTLAQVLPSPAGGARAGDGGIRQLFVESLYFLYRLLFILYAESRDLLPVGESPVYRDTYSAEHLREMAEHPLHAEDADRTYYTETLRTLFRMLHEGFPPPGFLASEDRSGGFSRVASPFTIPPYDGQLFDPARTALLDRCRVPDRAMREVIRELSLSRPRHRNDRRERYSYADLGVDQLGSIYEGLLVYEPMIVIEEMVVAQVKGEERLVTRAQSEEYGLELVRGPNGMPTVLRPGAFALRLWGGRRKGTGSYYTPHEITSFLVKEALEPLVQPIVEGCAASDSPSPARGRGSRRVRARQPDEILELKVCDPAMGSGAFLIQACRYLAEAYGRARIAAGLDEPGRTSQEAFAHYKRRVAETCLYGVDLNPLAVELAKVSLWLEMLAADRPLTFLDAHLRCGNSLIGAPLRDAEGQFTIERLSSVPDAALQEVSREATQERKAAARARVQRNREEVKRLGQQKQQSLLPGADWGILSLREIEAALADTLAQRLDLERSDEDLPISEAVALVHEKEQHFEALEHAAASRYRRAKAVCDLWCAIWFWPEPGTEIETVRGGNRLTAVVSAPPTTQALLELAGGILGTDPGSLDENEREAYLRTAEWVTGEQRFFHWELEFPEVWRERNRQPKRSGGFDAMVGNPPWDVLEAKTKEFYANFDPLFPFYKKSQAMLVAERLRSDSLAVDMAWRKYESDLAQTSNWARKSGKFDLLGSGKIDIYKLFSELFCSRARIDGRVSLVLPSGIYTDQGATELRGYLFDKTAGCKLLAIDNRGQLFPIHNWAKFVLLTFRKSPQSTLLECAFLLGKDLAGRRRAPDARELPEVLGTLDKSWIRLSKELVREFDPGALTIPEFKNERDVEIYSAVNATAPKLGATLEDHWNVSFGSDREFNTTADSALFVDNNECFARLFWQGTGEDMSPLIEGRCVGSHTLTAKRWVRGRGRAAVWQDTPPSLASSAFSPWNPQFWVSRQICVERFGCDYLARSWRVGIPNVASPENERTLQASVLPDSVYTTHSVQLVYVAIDEGRAFVSYYLAGALNSFLLDFVIRMKVKLNLSLFFLETLPVPRTGPQVSRIADLSQALVWDPAYAKNLPQLDPAPVGVIAEDVERAKLRAEIDALVADLYGLSEEDFAYILTTFPLLDRSQPPLPGEQKSFITRDLALLELFRLRGKAPPQDIVSFYAAAGADISRITGPLRGLENRVAEARRLGAAAYIPSGRGGDVEEGEDAEAQLELIDEVPE